MRTGAALKSRSASAVSATGRCGWMYLRSIGTRLDAASIGEAVNAASGDIDAMSDLHASAAYRRRVAVTLGIRALEAARDNAAANPGKGAR